MSVPARITVTGGAGGRGLPEQRPMAMNRRRKAHVLLNFIR